MEAVPVKEELRPTPLAVDPTLRVFVEDAPWDKDIFEGLNGFP